MQPQNQINTQNESKSIHNLNLIEDSKFIYKTNKNHDKNFNM